ncbi:prepilin peptidase [Corynebacterium jeddahense]|uniref:Type IV leader peptidase family protein n=1 Tax=Corynebacterium jeddahense TaxID=1414719 RepID=A0ABY7UJU5_9CORY|nr:prepilin peptidase [Corynebacterium jeddahense]WCZ39010.1 Type IV leader peptidase family protein [Corynebacterium jeddahense]
MGSGGIALAAVWTAVLCASDLKRRRLPDGCTVPPALAGIVGCVAAPHCAWGLVWPALYLLLGRGFGGGDVKLAVSLGVACAALAGPTGVLAAMGLSGLLTVASAALRRERVVAHGPAMLAAAWAVGLAGVAARGV